MIYTVHLDDTYSNIQGILQEIRSQKQGVRFEYISDANNIKQKDYMTSEEFWHEADKRITKICKHYGVL